MRLFVRPATLLASTALIAVGLVLTACNSDGDSGASGGSDAPFGSLPSDESAPSAAVAAPSAVGTPEEPEDATACLLLPEAEVVATFEVEVVTQTTGSGHVNQGELEWDYVSCTWFTAGQINLQLKIADAEDVSDGALSCPTLTHYGREAAPVGLSGARASWVEHTDAATEGSLRACTDTHVIDLVADRNGQVSGAKLLEPTLAAAEKVVGALGD
ncbi:hypothetical protein [Nocardioides alcanivorans]|uniref:hypothetical protein n=1 Tax=Nocardioides alcanivorans TaxID=2897352 RepID=UPI001F218E08|nr:hypothetical protein [Nocardioides alcanivorans]